MLASIADPTTPAERSALMALDRSRIGVAYDPYAYEVTRVKIREYAAALDEVDARYFSDGDDCVAPPTFAATFTIMQPTSVLLADDGLGMHMNLVHGNQAYEFGERPLRPGDVVTCTPTITDIRSRGGNEMLTLEVDCRFEDATLAVASTTLLVLFGSAGTDQSEETA